MAEEVRSECSALVVRNARELGQALVANRDKVHLLTSFASTEFSEDIVAPGFKPSLRIMTVDPDPTHGEVYASLDRRGELALTKIALDKLAHLAGIEWSDVSKVDDGTNPCYAHYKAKGTMLDIDGTERVVELSRPINLTDGSPEAKAMTPAQLAKARQNISMLSESKCKNRVIRTLLGLPQSFRPAELQKPFMVLKIVPDMNDPEVKRMVQAKMMHLEKYLFVPQEPVETEKPLAIAPPRGAEGLALQPPPGSSQGVIDITAQQGEDEALIKRAEQIKKILGYYETKTIDGKRDASKPPLEALSNDELNAIEEAFKQRPDIRQPKKAADDLI